MLAYPMLNMTRCCFQSVCTECFLQLRPPRHNKEPCPFCKYRKVEVIFRGPRPREELDRELSDQKRFHEALQRSRLLENATLSSHRQSSTIPSSGISEASHERPTRPTSLSGTVIISPVTSGGSSALSLPQARHDPRSETKSFQRHCKPRYQFSGDGQHSSAAPIPNSSDSSSDDSGSPVMNCSASASVGSPSVSGSPSAYSPLASLRSASQTSLSCPSTSHSDIGSWVAEPSEEVLQRHGPVPTNICNSSEPPPRKGEPALEEMQGAPSSPAIETREDSSVAEADSPSRSIHGANLQTSCHYVMMQPLRNMCNLADYENSLIRAAIQRSLVDF